MEWNCHASVALNNSDNILGYAVAHKMLRVEEGWKTGPCFAGNSTIAKRLYKYLCEKSIVSNNSEAVIAVSAAR